MALDWSSLVVAEILANVIPEVLGAHQIHLNVETGNYAFGWSSLDAVLKCSRLTCKNWARKIDIPQARLRGYPPKERFLKFIRKRTGRVSRVEIWLPQPKKHEALIDLAIQEMGRSRALRVVDLTGHPLTEANILQVGALLRAPIRLEALGLRRVARGSNLLFSTISEALKANTSLRTLLISENASVMTEISLRPLAEALEVNSTLSFLDLSDSYFSDLEPFCESLKRNRGLRHLDLRQGDFHSGAWASLFESLCSNSVLTDLNVSGSKQCSKEVVGVAISKLLTCPSSHLRSLKAAWLGGEEKAPFALPFVSSLARNSNLQILNIKGAGVTEEGWEQLASAMKQNRTLSELGVGFNPISPGLFGELCRSLHENKTLRTLDMSECDFGSAGFLDLEQLLFANSTISQLVLARNRVEKDDFYHFCGALYGNSSIQALDLELCLVEKESLSTLADAIYYAPNLNSVNSKNCPPMAGSRYTSWIDEAINRRNRLATNQCDQIVSPHCGRTDPRSRSTRRS